MVQCFYFLRTINVYNVSFPKPSLNMDQHIILNLVNPFNVLITETNVCVIKTLFSTEVNSNW